MDHGAVTPAAAALAALVFGLASGDPTAGLRGSPAERNRALHELHALGRSLGTPYLLPLFGDAAPVVRADACVGAAELGGPFLEGRVRAALHDADLDVRAACVRTATLLGDRAAAGELASLLRDDPSPLLRADAARALASVGEPSRLDALGAAAGRDPDARVRCACVEAIAKLGLASPSRAARALRAKGARGSCGLRGVATAAGFGDRRSVRELKDILRRGPRDERLETVSSLAPVPKTWAGDLLVAALRDDDPLLRLAAAEALRSRGDPRGVEFLVRAAPVAEPAFAARVERALAASGVTDAQRATLLASPPSPGVAAALARR